MTQYQIKDEGDLRKYFTQIPNMVDDANLSMIAFRLYVHLKRVAGDSGTCYQSTPTLSLACKMSMGAVSKAKIELTKAGLITIVIKKDNLKSYHEITISDIWTPNIQKYASLSPDEHSLSPDEIPLSRSEKPLSPGETKNNNTKKNHIKNNLPAKAGTPKIDYFPIAFILSKVTFMDLEKNKGRIFGEAKKYKPEDISKIETDYSPGGLWYLCDWRGIKGQPPSLTQVRETWGNLVLPINSNNKNHIPPVQEDPNERAKIDEAFREM
ncbi:MAG TPA: helix-turn-helix domain-containing protein [Anaerolineaceae bacterium]|nr:helix-turn-helix domain-containing protein [Anaerolineaceae bacterium]